MESKKILIIEDDLTLRNVLSEFLETEGFSVKVASDGEEGLNLLNGSDFDVVLLDIILPKKNGFEVLKEVRSNEEKSSIPFILLTNLGSLNDIEKSFGVRCDNVFGKRGLSDKRDSGKNKRSFSEIAGLIVTVTY